jgi:hypothetical protein
MVAMALIERFLGTKLVKHSLELAHVQPALLAPLGIPLELRCGNELQGMAPLFVKRGEHGRRRIEGVRAP